MFCQIVVAAARGPSETAGFDEAFGGARAATERFTTSLRAADLVIVRIEPIQHAAPGRGGRFPMEVRQQIEGHKPFRRAPAAGLGDDDLFRDLAAVVNIAIVAPAFAPPLDRLQGGLMGIVGEDGDLERARVDVKLRHWMNPFVIVVFLDVLPTVLVIAGLRTRPVNPRRKIRERFSRAGFTTHAEKRGFCREGLEFRG